MEDGFSHRQLLVYGRRVIASAQLRGQHRHRTAAAPRAGPRWQTRSRRRFRGRGLQIKFKSLFVFFRENH